MPLETWVLSSMANYPRTTPFQLVLAKHNACREGRVWVGYRSLPEFWRRCRRGDWMLWLSTIAKANANAMHRGLVWLALEVGAEDMDQVVAILEHKTKKDRRRIVRRLARRLRRLVHIDDLKRGLGLTKETL
jgi:hypothetical protein